MSAVFFAFCVGPLLGLGLLDGPSVAFSPDFLERKGSGAVPVLRQVDCVLVNGLTDR